MTALSMCGACGVVKPSTQRCRCRRPSSGPLASALGSDPVRLDGERRLGHLPTSDQQDAIATRRLIRRLRARKDKATP